MPTPTLGALELAVLLTVARLGDGAYGLVVRPAVAPAVRAHRGRALRDPPSGARRQVGVGQPRTRPEPGARMTDHPAPRRAELLLEALRADTDCREAVVGD